ncbi:MAG: helix-turn-helix domain-containing protein [Eubacteriales bacterium]|nr:helix-turn-helix domain-containing protein [Eubacteriales bacterium]
MVISRFEKFIRYINEIDLYWHRIASMEMKEYGFKGSSAIYFTQLLNNSGSVTSAELAAICGRDKADVSRELAALEKAGLITRGDGSTRNYRAPIFLTEKGTKLAHEIFEKADYAVEAVGKSLSDEERKFFYSSLEKISVGIRTLSETGITKKGKEKA